MDEIMAEVDLARVPRTTTLTLLTDWPLSKPNRDLNGDQKAAVVGGVRRHVISSANRKAVWRRVMVPGSLLWLTMQDEVFRGSYGMSTRTRYLAERLVAPRLLEDPEVLAHLSAMGLTDQAQRRHVVEHIGEVLFRVVQKAEDRGGEADSGDADERPEKVAGGQDDLVPGGLLVPDSRDKAIAAYGQSEIERLCSLVRDQILKVRDRRKLEKGLLAKELGRLLSRDQASAALWSLSRLERLGIDGALFGTMVTQHDYRIAAPSAIQVSHSITVHRAFDFETLEIARDDLEVGPQAAAMLDASYASGLYATSITIDHCQVIENVMRPDLHGDPKMPWHQRIRFRAWSDAGDAERELATRLARALVISILFASDHAMKTQTNARVYPSYALAETSAKGGINLLGAFSEPVNERRTNSILATAIERLRGYSGRFDSAYGMAARRAEFTPNPQTELAPKPEGWTSDRVTTAEALADWVEARVGETQVA